LYVYDRGVELGHAVVVTDVEYIPTPDGPVVTWLAYRDPKETTNALYVLLV